MESNFMKPFLQTIVLKVLHFYLCLVSPSYSRNTKLRAVQSRCKLLQPTRDLWGSSPDKSLAGPRQCDVESYCERDVFISSSFARDIGWADMRRVTMVSLHNDSRGRWLSRTWEPGRVLTKSDKDYYDLDLFHYMLEEDMKKDIMGHFEPREPLNILDIATSRAAGRPPVLLVCVHGVRDLVEYLRGNEPQEGVALVKENRDNNDQKRGRRTIPVENPSRLSEDLTSLAEKFKTEAAVARDKVRWWIEARIAGAEERKQGMQRATELMAQLEKKRVNQKLEEMKKEHQKRMEERQREHQREIEEGLRELEGLEKEKKRLRAELEVLKPIQSSRA
ncbi:hypothetical protein BKA70DRAFT_1227174 [Coprinopsis sp. MPI-PUGE-AT-0042]|nr:hypothetical protein BKA70DRAFT_1227174 [Coprinopsis sp. MPI-PUGE-AT-0042]